MVVAIDGPAGSGKTTVSRLLAEKLKFSYLDTGATYRAVTLKALQENLDLDDQTAMGRLAEELDLEFKGSRVFVDGKEVTEDIRMPVIAKNISRIAANPLVREKLVLLQRRLAEDKDVVVEGRDITTVVFPAAEHKFYLDADVGSRAGRRHKELKQKGIDISLEEITMQVEQRDRADFSRAHGPLKRTDDACYVDTSDLNIAQVVDKLASYIISK